MRKRLNFLERGKSKTIATAIFVVAFATIVSVPYEVNAGSYSDDEKQKMEELWEVATLWEVGENREKVPKAREQLIKFGEKAVEFILTEKMDTIDSLQTRAIDVVIQALPEISKPMMMSALERETRQNACANIIRLLASLKAVEASPTIMQILLNGKLASGTPLNPRLRRTILDALGTLDYEPALGIVAESLRTGDERERLVCAQSLARFSSLEKLRYLFNALGDERFTVRMSAFDGLKEAFRKDPKEVWERLGKSLLEGSMAEGGGSEELASVERRKGEILGLLGEFGAILADKIYGFKLSVPIEEEKASEILERIIDELSLKARDEKWESRFRATLALSKIDCPRARQTLRERAKLEENELVLQVILDALGIEKRTF